jgi:polysaccharide deacetylase 2 family uncharacterized protein YibQ
MRSVAGEDGRRLATVIPADGAADDIHHRFEIVVGNVRADAKAGRGMARLQAAVSLAICTRQASAGVNQDILVIIGLC